jgi:hypothetical protein
MTKARITRLWVWSLVAMIPAGILIPSSALALAATHGHASGNYTKTMVSLIVLSGVLAVGGLVVELVGWIQAISNTRPLKDVRWFKALLWGGVAGILTMPLFGLGWLVLASVMTAYLVAGPDGLAIEPRAMTLPKRAITKWAGRGFEVGAAGACLALVVAYLTGYGRPLQGVLWPSLAIVSTGFTLIAVGSMVVWAAWWAALFNAHGLAGRTWFNRLLWSGIAAVLTMPLFGFGVLILAAVFLTYRRSAPGGMVPRSEVPTPTVPASELVKTR